jgi:hypothetical protein
MFPEWHDEKQSYFDQWLPTALLLLQNEEHGITINREKFPSYGYPPAKAADQQQK